MTYLFDVDVAKEYGVDCAIMIQNFQFWITHNKANNNFMYDGHYWTFNSIKAFQDLFPFWSRRQIETILNKLIEKKVLIKGNYNLKAYDRTCWYAFHEEEKWISPKCEMDFTESGNGFHENVEPIPDINKDIKTKIDDVDVDVEYFMDTWNGPVSRNCDNTTKIISFNKERVESLKQVVKLVTPLMVGKWKREKPERYILKTFQGEYYQSEYMSHGRPVGVDFVLKNFEKIAEGFYRDSK